jgi:predicted transcriptional regulator
VLIYETSPIQRITGHFSIGRVVVNPKEDVHQMESDPEIRSDVSEYLEGARQSCALEILRPVRWATPRLLAELRDGLRPPQSFRFLRIGHELGDRDPILRILGESPVHPGVGRP